MTSPGKYGGCDQVLPPWPWPLTFSFGAVKARPWVENGQVVARKTMRLTVTADRRLANGAPLARFAERVKELLEAPKLLGPPANDRDRGPGTAQAQNRSTKIRVSEIIPHREALAVETGTEA